MSTNAERRPGKAKHERVLLWIGQLLVILLAVVGSLSTHSALRDAARSDAFHAAPVCPSTTAPTGDCVAWQQETVSSVSSPPRGNTILYLSASGQRLLFINYQGWVASLSPGATVFILVWENQAQAIRQPDGVALYPDSSAALMGNDDTATAVWVFGVAVLLAAALVGISPPRRMRPRLTALLVAGIGDLGASGFITGATIQLFRSTLPGLIGGTICFIVVGVLVFGYRRLQEERRRRAARLPATG
jgi:hypothetical protein